MHNTIPSIEENALRAFYDGWLGKHLQQRYR